MPLLLLLAMLCGESWARDDSYQIQVQSVIRAQERLCVFVPCTFTYPHDNWQQYPTYGYWYQLPAKQYDYTKRDLVATNHQNEKVSPSTQGRFQLVGNPEDRNCSLLITDVQKRDQGMYYFRVENGHFIRFSYLIIVSLEVTDLMEPDIYILEPLWPNRWGTIICVFNATFDGCPAPSFNWAGTPLSSNQSQVGTHQSSVLKIALQPGDQGTDLTCSVIFAPCGMVVQKTLWLDVAYVPKDLVINVSLGVGVVLKSHDGGAPFFHMQVQKGDFVQLPCEAVSHPPASLSWSREDRILSCSHPEDPKALALVLPSVMEEDTGSYTCRAKNVLGHQIRTVHLEVQYAPEDLSVTVSVENRTVLKTLGNARTLQVLQGQSLQLHCVAHSSPLTMLSWVRVPVTLSPVLPTEPGLLLLPEIQLDQEGEFTCQAQNPLGSLHVCVQLFVQENPTTCPCESRGSWPLLLTVVRGALMGTGFLLTYSLTWVYYSRCGHTRGRTQ